MKKLKRSAIEFIVLMSIWLILYKTNVLRFEGLNSIVKLSIYWIFFAICITISRKCIKKDK